MATNSITQSQISAKNASSPEKLNSFQEESLKGLEGPDKARMEAQFKMQNYQEMVSFISNAAKKRNEIAMAVIGNVR